MRLECLHAAGASLTAGPVTAGEEVLRSVAQVVLRRARTAAWRLLQEKLARGAGCDAAEGAPRLPATCSTLRSLSIQELASSPAVLLNAVIGDVLPLVRPGDCQSWMRIPILEEALAEVTARWSQGGASGLSGALAQVIRRRMRAQVAGPGCDVASSTPDKALWVAGMCLIEAQAPASFSRCDVEGWASECSAPKSTDRIHQLWTIAGKLHATPGRTSPADHVGLVTGVYVPLLDFN